MNRSGSISLFGLFYDCYLFICDLAIPLNTVTLQASQTTIQVGQALTLTCSAYAFPKAKVSWVKDNLLLTASNGSNITFSYHPTSAVAISMIDIPSVGLTNGGEYYCLGQDTYSNKFVRSNTVNIGKDFLDWLVTIFSECKLIGNKATTLALISAFLIYLE